MISGIISGILAGYVASRLQKGEGSGCLVNLFLGIIGGLVGGWLFGLLGISAYGWIGELITAMLVLLLFCGCLLNLDSHVIIYLDNTI